MHIYKPNSRGGGSAMGFSVTPDGDKAGIYCEILKQKSWDDSSKTGSFDSSKEGKINIKFGNHEIAEMLSICMRQRGSAKFFHKTPSSTATITFGTWPQEGEAKGIALGVIKGDKKASVPLSFSESTLLGEWFRFALNLMFRAEFSKRKEFFENRKEQ